MVYGQDHKQKDDIASEVLEHLKNPPIEVINPKKNHSNTKKYLIIAIAVLVVLSAGGFGAWKFLLSDDNTSNQTEPEAESPSNANEEVSINELTEEYSSDRLLIDFKYPANWKVDEDSGEIIVYSPEEEITDIGGENVSGEFKILIKQGADKSDSEYLGRGFAVGKSQPFKYSDPTASQREESFITDFGLDASDNFAYFVAQGNFELKKNETLGSDFAGKADEVLVSGGLYSKGSEDKTKLVSLNPKDYLSNETYLLAIEIVKTLRLR
ncbi:MAG: hypothetical protein WD885_00915 [Candidatus Saccharimonadales bacterium]